MFFVSVYSLYICRVERFVLCWIVSVYAQELSVSICLFFNEKAFFTLILPKSYEQLNKCDKQKTLRRIESIFRSNFSEKK